MEDNIWDAGDLNPDSAMSPVQIRSVRTIIRRIQVPSLPMEATRPKAVECVNLFVGSAALSSVNAGVQLSMISDLLKIKLFWLLSLFCRGCRFAQFPMCWESNWTQFVLG